MSYVLYFSLAFLLVIVILFTTIASGEVFKPSPEPVQQISTGNATTCAVKSGTVYCWGSNQYGQLGNGMSGEGASSYRSTPTRVADNKDPIAEVKICTFTLFGTCLAWQTIAPAIPASPLAGKYVTKVSVGTDHVCAIANARSYCWGHNSHGQLGNTSTADSAIPVAVDAAGTSALKNKEVIDISAAQYFTCALASDGTIACWGEGDNGRLGTNSTDDSRSPQAIYTQGDLSGKKGLQLAQSSGAAMCVIAVPKSTNPTSAAGVPYCWGLGMGDGKRPDSSSTNCNKRGGVPSVLGVSLLQSSTEIHYFDAKTPVDSSGATNLFDSIATAENAQITGLGSGQLYYWGLHGYQIQKGETTDGCPPAGRELYCGTKYMGYQGNNLRCFNNNSAEDCHPVDYANALLCDTKSHNPCSNDSCGNPSTKPYYYARTFTSVTSLGTITARGPLYTEEGPLRQKTMSVASGNAYDGLFCAKINATIATLYCDVHDTSAHQGQTGSGYTQQCITGWFGEKNCTWPPIAGPQQVSDSGWLQGKEVTALSTGASGYTCVIASGQVGCWGINGSGQLGVGDTTNRNIPTGVVW